MFPLTAQEMTAQIGYGPCIGFLVSVNLAGAVPKPAETSTSAQGPSRSINPITGTYELSEAEKARDPINDMTDEEKEAEAEKLFSLFDRMNKTGVIKVQNPLENAQAQGRFQEITDDEEKRAQEEEDEEEKSALRELAQWREERRKKRG
jgi:Guanine nucleotide exchange factor synembryn